MNFSKSKLAVAFAMTTLIAGCGGGEEESAGTSSGSVSPPNITLATQTLTITEGDEGERKIDDLSLRLSKTHSSSITVNYHSVDNTALAGKRYQETSGSITFAPGEREQSIDVTVIGNDDFEPDQTFEIELTLVAGTSAKLINPKATITIRDDDPEPTVDFEVERIDVREGVGVVDIFATLDRGSYREVSLTLDFDGLASSNNDYSINSNTITFAPNTTRSSTYITIFEDAIIEGSEFIDVSVKSVSNGDKGLLDEMKVLILGDLKLNDSGVVSYYNNGDFSSNTPDGEHSNQDADFGLDRNDAYRNNGFAGLVYNKIDNSGNSLPPDASNHHCTFDAHTGLTWEIKGEYFYHEFIDKPNADELARELEITSQHFNNTNGRYMWYNANDKENGGSKGGVNSQELTSPVLASTGGCMFPPRDHPLYVSGASTKGCTTDKYQELINTSSRCGFVNWRLPTINELQTLMIYEPEHRGFDQDYFPDTKEGTATHYGADFVYLSSTPSVDNDASVWCLDVAKRQVKLCNKTERQHVRLVRGNEF